MTPADPSSGHPFSWPITEFARALGAKSLAMLIGYFDDSGTHEQAPVCLLAGFIANSVTGAKILVCGDGAEFTLLNKGESQS